MRIAIFFLMIISVLFTVICGLGSALAVADALNGGEDRFFGIFLFVPPTVFLLFLSNYLKAKHDALVHAEIRSYILRFALKNQGLITATELASEGVLSIDKARKHLDRMYIEGLCEKRITDKFVYIYGFSEVLSTEEKINSTTITS